ncbi:MAG: NAD-dependent epimerase/dehydratase family protein [Bacteroidales bacterium]|nr:NAD-dependent epimerase/dehydratase family protein [Bacteroidales bacterium]
MNKTACIFGSTGLIGSHLLDLLVNDSRYERIIVFNRSLKDHTHPKIRQILSDYESISEVSNDLVANEYYCCLGTTIKKAKTREAFEYVDYLLPLQIARIAIENKVDKYLIVSSIGASEQSRNFYLRTKGKMEQEVSRLGIKRLHIFRPSMLLGKRNEKRLAESVGQVFMKFFGFLMFGVLRKYKAIHAKTVAAAMLAVANQNTDKKFFASDEIENIGQSGKI